MKVDTKEIASVLGISEAHIPLLVGSFLDESKSILENLSAGVAAQDFSEITLHGHSIKGSAANLRLNDIAELAKSIEMAGKAEDSSFDFEGSSQRLKAMIEDLEL